MLVAEHLIHDFGSTRALDGASIIIEQGEATALVGPSGSGKTTLLYCLAALLRPQKGSVRFKGQEISKCTTEQAAALRRENFGFVFQSAELVPELTLRENLTLPLELLHVSGRERRQRVGSLLDELGIAPHADRRPAQVSGGQAQRAAVARAVIHRPSVVFADEPTGALDTANGQVVADLLWRLTREVGTALVLVTHDRGLATRADRVVELRDGKTAKTVDVHGGANP